MAAASGTAAKPARAKSKLEAASASLSDSSSGQDDGIELSPLTDLPTFVAIRFNKMLDRSVVESTLNMTNISLTDAHIGAIAKRVEKGSWKRIWLSFNNITDAGFVQLVNALKACGRLSHVEELSVAANRLTDTGVLALVDALSIESACALRALDLSNNKSIGDAAVMALCQLQRKTKSLRKLSLNNTRISNVSCVHLCAVVRESPLVELRLSGKHITAEYLSALTDVCWYSCLRSCIVSGPKVIDSETLTSFNRLMQAKNSNPVRVLETLLSVLVIPRLAQGSVLCMLDKTLFHKLAATLYPWNYPLVKNSSECDPSCT